MVANSANEHFSIVICGHVDSGKSTTTGRLIFELGGLPERELEKLKAEAERLGKGSFAFAFYMDRQKEKRERGGNSVKEHMPIVICCQVSPACLCRACSFGRVRCLLSGWRLLSRPTLLSRW